MNYNLIYESLIERSKNRESPGIIEKHHIIPRAFGGSNNKDNLANLTPREHFIAHLLLYRINKNDKKKANKMLTAVIMMKAKVISNGKLYEKARLEYSIYKSYLSTGKNNPMFGRKHSEESKDVMSKKSKKRFNDKTNHPMFGRKHSEESIIKNKKSNSLLIQIFDDNDELKFTSDMKFEDFCLKHNLPFKMFKKSYQDKGSRLYKKGKPRNKDWEKYKDWYALNVSLSKS